MLGRKGKTQRLSDHTASDAPCAVHPGYGIRINWVGKELYDHQVLAGRGGFKPALTCAYLLCMRCVWRCPPAQRLCPLASTGCSSQTEREAGNEPFK